MKRWLFCVLAHVCGGIWAQNLVPNPDFDQYESCPPYLGQIHQAVGWDSPNFATTDYFHACSDSVNGNGVPANRLGWQQARRGQGYAGLRLWIPPGISTPNQREYLVTELSAPLQADSLYRLGFYASLADFSTHTTDALGFGLSDTAWGQATFQPFEPALRLSPGDYLTDRDGWTWITGSYRARGGERHLILGNFLPDSALNLVEVVPQGEPVLAAYVYLDQISVEKIPLRSHSLDDSLPPDTIACPPGNGIRFETLDSLLCKAGSWRVAGPEGASRYLWENGTEERERDLQAAGRYQLTSYFPCDTLVQEIRVDTIDCGCGFLPQNVFSPNGDGINDRFDPQLASGVSELQLAIFDRWGRRVYATSRLAEARWDGQFQGRPAPAGTYFWSLSFRCQDGPEAEMRHARGDLWLVR